MRPSRSFTTLTLALIPVALALNIAGGQVLKSVLPLYLDTIGTVLVGALAGPWAGLVTGLLSNYVWTLSGLDANAIYFAPVGAAVGAMAGLLARRGAFRRVWTAGLGGLGTGVIAAILAAPIAAKVFGGVTGGATDLLVAAFREAGFGVMGAVAMQGAVSDPLDKALTFLIVFAVLRALPKRFLARFATPEDDSAEPLLDT